MAKTKKYRLVEARKHLTRAKEQWDQAVVDSWPPVEAAECVTKCFYSYENALVAAATALGVRWTKNHYQKADLARKLFDDNKVKTDVSDLLRDLNDLRKDVSYGEPGKELADTDLEELVSNLETFLGDVDDLITEMED